ncbi:MAG: hypothetical protein HRT89_18810 [Lentisphaeria bacterium]|nr:hypothetical protein [Lentisphaeria bacterium]
MFLLSVIICGYQISGDKLIGLFMGLLFAGLYATSACFSVNWMPKPFDGISIGILGLTLISIKRPWLLAAFSFLTCWSEERAILSLCFIGVFILLRADIDKAQKQKSCLIIAGAILAYFISRAILSFALGWSAPDVTQLGVNPLPVLLRYLPLTMWSCFEGAWIGIIAASWLLLKKKKRITTVLFVGSVLLALLSCMLAVDTSRSSSFAFPLIPLAFALLKDADISLHKFRILVGSAAAFSILIPNFEIMGTAIRWLPSLLRLTF